MDDGRPAQILAELVEQHYSVLYRYAYRLAGSVADAEDLVQQTFLTAQSKIDQLQEPDHARAWLFTITRNSYLKMIRGRSGVGHVSLEKAPELSDEGPIEADFDGERLQSVLNELDEEFRTPLILFYFDQFSYKEIAEQMDVPVGTVMSRLARAKSYLRRRLQSHQPAESRNA